MAEFHQMAAAVYLASGVGALLGVVLPSERMRRGAIWGLAIGALLHGLAFATLHQAETPPPLTDLASAVSLMAWIAVLFMLALMSRLRVPGLVAAVGPLAFLGVFVAALRLPHTVPAEAEAAAAAAGAWPHAHVVLASAGIALLGVAGVAGLFFLSEHRRLKSNRPPAGLFRLPTLEALDRVNVVALAIGFPLLSLGVITGMLWIYSESGVFWTGAGHESWSVVAWAIYAGLVVARFIAHQGARQAAASAVASFAFLLFAVVGVGIFT